MLMVACLEMTCNRGMLALIPKCLEHSYLRTERGQLLDIEPLKTLLGEVGLASRGRVEFVRVHGHRLRGNLLSDRK